MEIHAVNYTFYKDGVKIVVACKLLQTKRKEDVVKNMYQLLWGMVAHREDKSVNAKCYLLQGNCPSILEALLFVEKNYDALCNT